MSDILLNLKILLAFWDIIRRRDFMLGRAVCYYKDAVFDTRELLLVYYHHDYHHYS